MLADPGPSVLERVSAGLAEAGEERLWAASDDEVVGRVAAALRVRAQADAVLLGAVGEVEARGLARARGASSTRAWLIGAHRVDPGEAGMLVRTGRSLRMGCQATGLALAASEVSLAQARVIIRSVQDLPTDLGPGLVAAGETTMIGHAAVFDPSKLALIGRRLAECLDPEGTQARDEKKFLEKERTAHAQRSLILVADKDGAGRYLRGYADTEGGRSSPPPWTDCPRRSRPPRPGRIRAVRPSAASMPWSNSAAGRSPAVGCPPRVGSNPGS